MVDSSGGAIDPLSGTIDLNLCSYSYSKTLESIQGDRLLDEAGTSISSTFVNEIPILNFEYEYRFTEHEQEYEHRDAEYGKVF